MRSCSKCGAGHVFSGNSVVCKRCRFTVTGSSKWDALYKWNALMPGKTPEERLSEEMLAQEPEEFAFLLGFVKGKSLLEIGSRYGLSLKAQAQRLPKGSRIVSLDLGQCPYSPGVDTQAFRRESCEELKAMGYEVHMLTGDSHDPEMIEAVRKLGPFDFVFIDGDHSMDGVIQDWESFGPMGKVVAFHDINGSNQMLKFFMSLPHEKEACVRSNMGIGIVFR